MDEEGPPMEIALMVMFESLRTEPNNQIQMLQMKGPVVSSFSNSFFFSRILSLYPNTFWGILDQYETWLT